MRMAQLCSSRVLRNALIAGTAGVFFTPSTAGADNPANPDVLTYRA